MNTCDTCKYWQPGDGYYCPKAWGYCGKPQEWRYPNKVPDSGFSEPGIYTCGHGESDPGGFKTGPDFGCIHHAPKPAANSPH